METTLPIESIPSNQSALLRILFLIKFCKTQSHGITVNTVPIANKTLPEIKLKFQCKTFTKTPKSVTNKPAMAINKSSFLEIRSGFIFFTITSNTD